MFYVIPGDVYCNENGGGEGGDTRLTHAFAAKLLGIGLLLLVLLVWLALERVFFH